MRPWPATKPAWTPHDRHCRIQARISQSNHREHIRHTTWSIRVCSPKAAPASYRLARVVAQNILRTGGRMKYAWRICVMAASALTLLSGCRQPSMDLAQGPDWPGGVPPLLGSSGKGLLTATIPPTVPSRISFQCWSHGLSAANRRGVDQDLSFREAVATMYACIAQRMPPDWTGRAASNGDVTNLLNGIRPKDPGFSIIPWFGKYQW